MDIGFIYWCQQLKEIIEKENTELRKGIKTRDYELELIRKNHAILHKAYLGYTENSEKLVKKLEQEIKALKKEIELLKGNSTK